MFLDEYGLPTQRDGDKNDQLQRVGMIVTALCLKEEIGFRELLERMIFRGALAVELQPKPGIYTRYVGGDPENVSADQLIAALCAHVADYDWKQVRLMFKACVKRFGFAQNVKDGLNGSEKKKIPDYLALRALPLFVRAHWLCYPLAVVVDLLLVFAALAACGPVWRDDKGFSKRSPDDVDDNCTIATLAVCRKRMPTPFSILACKLYGKLRPWNLGCRMNIKKGAWWGTYEFHPVQGSLAWYHRAEAGGNPEIAELWAPICEELFE